VRLLGRSEGARECEQRGRAGAKAMLDGEIVETAGAVASSHVSGRFSARGASVPAYTLRARLASLGRCVLQFHGRRWESSRRIRPCSCSCSAGPSLWAQTGAAVAVEAQRAGLWGRQRAESRGHDTICVVELGDVEGCTQPAMRDV
jgi:hypothetical protein